MKELALKNVKCYAGAKDQSILSRYVDKFHKEKHNDMKSNYLESSIARSMSQKVGF